jgi:hypothetical protein
MKIGDAMWGEGKDDMGRSLWVNLSLARTIRRDPTGRCTWITFEKEHAVSVVDGVEDLLSSATNPRSLKTRPQR